MSLSYSTFFLFLGGHFFLPCAPVHNDVASFSIHFLLVNSVVNGVFFSLINVVYFSLSCDRCIKGVNIDEIKGQLELENSTTLVVKNVM